MGRDIDRRRISILENTVKRMTRDRIKMIQAFQGAFNAMGEKLNALTQAITILGKRDPEVLKFVQVQPKEGSNEASSGDGQSRILPMSGNRADSGDQGTPESGEDSASSQIVKPSGSEK